MERCFRSEERQGWQADRTTGGGKDNRTAVKEAVQVVGSTRRDLVPNEQIYHAVHVHKDRLKEVADFVGLDCFTISIIANRTAEAGKTPKIKT